MIYESPQQADDIRQGDIFFLLPRIELSLDQILVVGEDENELVAWQDIAQRGPDPITIAVAARPVTAIVVTQDCDAQRATQIALCEIRELGKVVGDLGSTLAKFVKNVPKQTRANLKWFYLPPDASVGIVERMAVDFQVTLSVARVDLEKFRSFRRARLNPEADEHFRERLSEFFRRYPVDEWYPFTKEEFAKYKEDNPEAEPRSWQT